METDTYQPCVCIARCNHCICGALPPVGSGEQAGIPKWALDACSDEIKHVIQQIGEPYHGVIKRQLRIMERWRQFFAEQDNQYDH